ncbi:MAG: hypothetical protein JWO35_814 [Candidatus Saccharibacteria bacterium]|nr:hypothetical protein [Candidatus Saccharibacteria bacterium]
MRPAPSTAKIYIMHLLTFGLYFFYWCAKSRQAINQAARQQLVPKIWYLIIPGLSYWWVWEYANALEHVSYKRIRAVDTFSYYIIGTGFLFLLPTFPYIGSDDLGRNDTQIITVLLIMLGILIVLTSIGLAFFCSTIQKKINQTTPKASPPNTV